MKNPVEKQFLFTLAKKYIYGINLETSLGGTTYALVERSLKETLGYLGEERGNFQILVTYRGRRIEISI